MLTGASRKFAQVGLIALMVGGSLMLWLGDPMLWLWIGSHVTSSQQAQFGAYMLVGGGIVASTVLVSLALGRLHRAYERVTGARAVVRVTLPWLRSLRAERSAPRVTVLDLILVLSAIGALTGFGIWFFVFAGSSLPG